MSRQEVVVVTGASAGVGRAVVRAFARRKAAIGLLARGVDGLEGAKREVEQAGGKALVLPTDVSDPAAVEKAAEEVERQLGPIDIWVNNAMVSVFSPALKMTAEDFRRVTEVTYLGYVHGTLAALRRMATRNRGVVIQVGSALAYRGIPLQSAYCAAKHAIQGFNDSLRCELIHDQIDVRITEVHLPAMDTPQFDWSKSRMPRRAQPVPPIYDPDIAAEGIYWAAHNDQRELYIGYPTTMAIIGNKLTPGLGDWYLGMNGVESQMTDEPVDPNQPNNLYEPLPGDRGAHGRFGDRSIKYSWQLWASKHRRELALAGAALAGVACLLGASAASDGRPKRSRALPKSRVFSD